MYILGLNPQNFTKLTEAVLIGVLGAQKMIARDRLLYPTLTLIIDPYITQPPPPR